MGENDEFSFGHIRYKGLGSCFFENRIGYMSVKLRWKVRTEDTDLICEMYHLYDS